MLRSNFFAKQNEHIKYRSARSADWRALNAAAVSVWEMASIINALH